MITDAGNGPTYALGGMNVLREKARAGVLRALMLVKAGDQATWLLSKRSTITLQEVIDVLPPEMALYGTIAGIQLEGEEQPTSIVIYSGLHMEDLRQLTYARLYTSLKRTEEVKEFLKKCKEKAYIEEQMLKDPIPVVTLRRFSEKDQSQPHPSQQPKEK
ncbi:hypothetical protein EPA93_41280 [Ktedonosporobacter rubrisoli]|uniref:Uncharacterized protein n=1 Tax=Ktedonosporobacter rubrisoli TaxID=2509675 RepID=A0A4V0Z058_KTERU|nr:hypothetical protein [Ktedonosporobacter rubrisoli]QBD82071.1 hypothetical protein EPA93_41280 [Ktedonosporobacter rubrisoli]